MENYNNQQQPNNQSPVDPNQQYQPVGQPQTQNQPVMQNQQFQATQQPQSQSTGQYQPNQQPQPQSVQQPLVQNNPIQQNQSVSSPQPQSQPQPIIPNQPTSVSKPQSQLFNMIEISLVPDLKRDLLRAEKLKKQVLFISFLVMGISLGLTGILSSIAYGAQALKISNTEESISKTLSSIKNIKGVDEILAVQRQMTKLNQLHDEKLISSRVFMIIDRIVAGENNQNEENSLTKMSIVINKMEVDLENNKITISGQTEKGYIALEQLQKTLSETKVIYKTLNNQQDTSGDKEKSKEESEPEIYPFTEKVALESFPSLDDKDGKNQLTFKISFIIEENYFKNRENVKVALSGVDHKDVTDSYLAIPDSLFSNAKDNKEDDTQDVQNTSKLINNGKSSKEKE